jgi:hypothetical protein
MSIVFDIEDIDGSPTVHDNSVRVVEVFTDIGMVCPLGATHNP